MALRISICSILTVYCVSLVAQAGFNETFGPGVGCRFLNVQSDINGPVISGYYRKDVNSYQSGFIAQFDSLGQVQWWTEIADDSSSISILEETGSVVTQTGSVVVPFSFFHRGSVGLVQVDSSGEILFVHEYLRDSALVSAPRNIMAVSDGYLIIGWSQPPQYILNAFVLKTDLDGNEQWIKFYGAPQYEEAARTISRVADNIYMLSGVRYAVPPQPVFNHSWALAMDSVGNVLWEWEDSEEEIGEKGIASMQYDSLNKQWVYVSFIERPTTYPGEDYEVSVPILVFRDSAMNLLSFKEYGPYAINHYMGVLEPSHEEGWIATGSYTTTTDEYVSPLRSQSGRVMKFSADGTLEWSVIDTAFFHPELGSRSYLSGVTESPTGSIYAVGWANNYDENDDYRSYGWLLKITADGCVDTLCTSTSLLDEILLQQEKIRVYPNPASETITIELHDDLREEFTWQLFDLSGRIVRSEILNGSHEVTLSGMIPGMYGWRAVDTSGQLLKAGKLVIE